MGTGTHLGRVRGLGSAHEGVSHWWTQKLSAGSNLLLMAWLVLSIARLPAYDYATVSAWLHSAWVAVPMILLIASVFVHIRMGLQVAIEDYARDASRVVLLVLLNLFTIGAAGIAIFAILKVAFASTGALA